jgi:hypothetical protein
MGARHQDLLTDRQSQCDFDFDSDYDEGEFERGCKSAAEKGRQYV